VQDETLASGWWSPKAKGQRPTSNVRGRQPQNSGLAERRRRSISASEAGLPADVPLYPGATIQSVKPGTVDFQTDASLEAVKDFYVEKLTTAGWAPGDFSESAGISIKDWKKGNQTVTINVISIVENECLVTIEKK